MSGERLARWVHEERSRVNPSGRRACAGFEAARISGHLRVRRPWHPPCTCLGPATRGRMEETDMKIRIAGLATLLLASVAALTTVAPAADAGSRRSDWRHRDRDYR